MAAKSGSKRVLVEVVGSLNMDLVTVTPRVPGPGETINATSFSTGFGGKGANQAVAAARLLRQGPDAESDDDVEVSMSGAVGDDQFGKDFLKHLKDGEKVNVSAVMVKKGYKTGTSAILVEEESGENRILFTNGANGAFTPTDAARLRPTSAGQRHLIVLQMEIPAETLVACVEEAKAMGKEVVLNPAPAPVLPLPETVFHGLDHLIMNESEASIMSGIPEVEVTSSLDRVAEAFFKKGVKNVVVTLGSAGAYFRSHSSDTTRGQTVAAHKVQAVDTTAGGDCFVGAYVVHLAKHGNVDLAGAVASGNLAASIAVTKEGAQSSLPYGGEI